MSEISLYRKYRPQTFTNLVGQDHVRGTLVNAIITERLVHAYLFTGPRGTGKTSTARLFAKAINCERLKGDGEPCEECDICRDITIGRLIDVVEIDAASHTGVDDVRELIDGLNFAPTRAKNKIYIVDEVHMLSKGAFNALLKTLEEPPRNVYFILATTEVHKVPDTIISRCQRFDFKRIDAKTIMTRLYYIAQVEGITVEEEALDIIARHVDGGLRDAIGLFEQLIVNGALTRDHVKKVLGVAGRSAVQLLYERLSGGDLAGSLAYLQDLYREGVDFTQFTKELLEFVRGEMLHAVETKALDNVGRLVRMIEAFQRALDQLKTTLIVQLPLEIAVISLLVSADADATPAVDPAAAVGAVAATVPRVAGGLERQAATSAGGAASDVVGASVGNAPDARLTTPLPLEELQSLWPRVMERIKTPKLRTSLKSLRSLRVADRTITLVFDAKFHQDTVMQSELRRELEAMIEAVTGRAVKVTAVHEAVELHGPSDAEDSTATFNVANVAEVFGGEEIMEE